MSLIQPAGATRVVPAVLILFVLALAPTLIPWPGGAVPARAGERDQFPEPGQVNSSEPGPLGKAVARVARQARSDQGLADCEDAVRFLLHLYAEEGSVADRDRALAMARRLATGGAGAGSPQPLYLLAQAGLGTMGEAETLFNRRLEFMGAPDRATTDTYANFVRDLLSRANALRDPGLLLNALLATGDLFDNRTRVEGNRLIVLPGGSEAKTASLSDHVETLRAAVEAAQASGSPTLRRDAVRLGREILRNFWDDDRGRLRLSQDEGNDPVLTALLNMRAAQALWEAGWLGGDVLLTGRGRRALEGMLAEALSLPMVAPGAALAAARIGGHPVQMVLVGAPGDPTLVDLRQACVFLFEPRRLVLSLDPIADAARLEELGYPAEISPALFVCVDLICSAPITAPAEVDKTLRDILALAHEAQR